MANHTVLTQTPVGYWLIHILVNFTTVVTADLFILSILIHGIPRVEERGDIISENFYSALYCLLNV